MEVTIYIDVGFTGHLKYGTGTYNIMIEFINSKKEPVTRGIYEGVKYTTKNRTQLMACIAALQRLTKPCKVKIITNARFIVNSINQQWVRAKNLDLWKQFEALQRIHESITFQYEFSNPYSSYMAMEARHLNIEYREDTGNEDRR